MAVVDDCPHQNVLQKENLTNLVKERYRLLELYCGIGGMRFALDAARIPYEVVAAIDINPVVNTIYQHNFGSQGHYQKNILSFTTDDIENMKLDIITMSPPCQPFTRVGLKKDTEDERSKSFLHILKIINE
ncbi:tRNA (cytosine(38)-C(5))-methyltransferase [Araneus ventricosus]|uniref:tRNA (Cytosine(38)-C(5))-methyltransferase n=1 Tax=Araneus ventricosus TaxID=182803 RepID=A0A4Y2BZP8_ARAVE|nr:tRNA (cytosine(38)-C(5))-methyltransferase [Araneus ventricosus]